MTHSQVAQRSRFFRLASPFSVVDTGRITFMNPYSWLVNRNRGHADLESFTIYADGIALVWLYNVLCRTSIARYAFDYSSVAGAVFEDALVRVRPVFLIGGGQGVAADAAEVIRCRHPGLEIVGTRSGFFINRDEYDAALTDASRAAVVIVGMGAPVQEEFVADLWNRGWRGAAYTCGGFLEQIVGTDGDYFPRWSNRFHLRWVYRLYKEPRRLWKRYLVDYPKFLAIFIADWVRVRPGDAGGDAASLRRFDRERAGPRRRALRS
jgi:N-acetylglucosaminyldiphosphoundecaprenol N-acetyl-beta-D-mannosaminyltransferase